MCQLWGIILFNGWVLFSNHHWPNNEVELNLRSYANHFVIGFKLEFNWLATVGESYRNDETIF